MLTLKYGTKYDGRKPDGKPCCINSVSSFIKKVSKLQWKRGRRFYFRGDGHSLVPHVGKLWAFGDRTGLKLTDQERSLVNRFLRFANPEVRSDTALWEALFLARHHDLPTRLLDWSTNPLVALYLPSGWKPGNKNAKRARKKRNQRRIRRKRTRRTNMCGRSKSGPQKTGLTSMFLRREATLLIRPKFPSFQGARTRGSGWTRASLRSKSFCLSTTQHESQRSAVSSLGNRTRRTQLRAILIAPPSSRRRTWISHDCTDGLCPVSWTNVDS